MNDLSWRWVPINKLSECHLAGVQQTCSLICRVTGRTQHGQGRPGGNGFEYKASSVVEQRALVVIRFAMVVFRFPLGRTALNFVTRAMCGNQNLRRFSTRHATR